MQADVNSLLDAIKAQAWLTAPFTERQFLSEETLTAITEVPREEFVLKEDRGLAFENIPLGIGFDQTISQPFMVALMTDLIAPAQDHIILEIGTGSGYHTAVLARLARWIYTIESIVPLAEQARLRLARLGYHNIEIKTGNGYGGWPEHAPYDGIVVTAAVTAVPDLLLDQLKPGGRLVVPVGPPGEKQELILISKTDNGRMIREPVLSVAFGLLKGEQMPDDMIDD